VIYVANVEETAVLNGNKHVEALKELVKNEGAEVVMVCAAIEAQIAELESKEDRDAFLAEYGLKESGLNKLVHAAYHLLDLITYFTAGVQEVRAWTIHRGMTAPQSAGTIHTDFERGFIKADVQRWEDLVTLRSEAAVREKGLLRIEGKEYRVQDGDVMHFRFNV